MKIQTPTPTNGPAEVVKFQPRTLETKPGAHSRPGENGSANNRSAEPDDFRHRMWANAAALAFTVALTAVGIWLAVSIADMRKTQDCVLMGRRNCAPITEPNS
jgi:hypothetical protein